MIKALLCVLILFVCHELFARQNSQSADLTAKQRRVPVVLVVPFSSGNSEHAEILTSLFYGGLANSNEFIPVDRTVLQETIEEYIAQNDGNIWASMEKTINIGNVYNAEWIIRGTLITLDTGYSFLSVHVFDMNTLQQMGSEFLFITTATINTPAIIKQIDNFVKNSFIKCFYLGLPIPLSL
ncbi:MAG: hypothetical protein FWE37_00375 [Spirochaetaceae bacterium]|nr:hypothetical protein [Spirochaetaceae bacterium]